MYLTELHRWKHPHTFGTDQPRTGERRTRWVVAFTVAAAMTSTGMVLGRRIASLWGPRVEVLGGLIRGVKIVTEHLIA